MSDELKIRMEKVEKLRGTTIRDMVKITEWKDVQRAMKYWYPNTKKGTMQRYEEIFNWLRTIPRRTPKDKADFLEFSLDDELFWAVATAEKNKIEIAKDDYRQFYHINSTKYSLSFRSWASVANLEILPEHRRNIPRAEMIAHFLWEITFYGFTEKEMNKVGKELLKTVKEAKKDIQKRENGVTG